MLLLPCGWSFRWYYVLNECTDPNPLARIAVAVQSFIDSEGTDLSEVLALCGCGSHQSSTSDSSAVAATALQPTALLGAEPTWDQNKDPSLHNDTVPCSFTYFLLNKCYDDADELAYLVDEQGFNMMDFIGRTENMVEHLTEALIRAGVLSLDTMRVHVHDRCSFFGVCTCLNRGMRNKLVCAHFSHAGNNATLATQCAESLVNENSAWHEPYELYYDWAKSQQYAGDLFKVDAETFRYAYNTSDPTYIPRFHHATSPRRHAGTA